PHHDASAKQRLPPCGSGASVTGRVCGRVTGSPGLPVARRDRINAHRFASTRAPKPPGYLESVSQALELTKALIARRSVTPADEGCQPILMERLAAAGFAIERLSFGGVENFWARHG